MSLIDISTIDIAQPRCPTCNSTGFTPSIIPDQCQFCDGTFGGNPPTQEDLMNSESFKHILASASSIIASWRSCVILAVEAERQLLDLGFYNISFRGRKVRGAWNGNEFQLEE